MLQRPFHILHSPHFPAYITTRLTRLQIASIGSLSLQKRVDDKELSHNVEHVKEFGEEKREGQIEERLLLPTLLAEDEVAFEVGVDDVASVGANHVASMLLGIDTHFAQLVSAWEGEADGIVVGDG